MLNDLFFTFVEQGRTSPKVLRQPSRTTAGGSYMAKLGDYQFCLDTAAFQQLQRTTEYRWATINRIGREPATQFTGKGEDTIELSGVIYPHFRGGLSQVSQMRQSADKGEPLAMVYAFEQVGQYCGRWVIKSVREGRTEFMRDGTPRKMEFTLSLLAYGEDAGVAGGGSVINLLSNVASGFATSTAVPVPSLLGEVGDALLKSATGINSLPNILADSPLSDVHTVADAVSNIASAAGGIANVARNVISSAMSSLPPGVVSLIPPGAMSAASQLIYAGDMVGLAQRDVLANIGVFYDSPAGVRRSAKDFDTSMKGVMRTSVVNGGTCRSAAINLAAMPKTGGISDIDRMLSAASLNNIARAADNLVFASSESSRQASIIVDQINV